MFVIRLQTQVHLIQRSLYSILSRSTLKNHIGCCFIYFLFFFFFGPIFDSLVQGMPAEGCSGECLQVSW